MGGAAPLVGPTEEWAVSHQELVGFQNSGKRQKISKENMRR